MVAGVIAGVSVDEVSLRRPKNITLLEIATGLRRSAARSKWFRFVFETEFSIQSGTF